MFSSACWMRCGLFRVEHLALLERPLERVFRSSSVCWFHSLKPMYWFWKPLSQEEIRERLQQIFGAEAEVVAGVTRIADRLH